MKFLQSGFIWRYYGFTKTHVRGLFVTSALLGMTGVAILTFALLSIQSLPDATFYKLVAGSAAIMLVDIEMIMFSIFSILFYSLAKYNENIASEPAEQNAAEQPATRL